VDVCDEEMAPMAVEIKFDADSFNDDFDDDL
jgi:hypothetical protein